MLHYCLTHEQGLLPAGYDLGSQRVCEASWHPLSQWRLRLAVAYARAFGCAKAIVLVPASCPLCERDGDDTHLGSLYHG